MAEDRLWWSRALSTQAITMLTEVWFARAASFRAFQNASSRLTLVLCPLITIERFCTVDFMVVSDTHRREHDWFSQPPTPSFNRPMVSDRIHTLSHTVK